MSGFDEMAGGIVPEGDAIRRAVQWISLRRQEEPTARIAEIVGEAARRFDLNAKEELALVHILSTEATSR
jgi:hypothetical protein